MIVIFKSTTEGVDYYSTFNEQRNPIGRKYLKHVFYSQDGAVMEPSRYSNFNISLSLIIPLYYFRLRV